MPPTDMVKTLSRTDRTIDNFRKFLILQGVLIDGEEEVLGNPMPFEALVPAVDSNSNKVGLYKCLPMSVCTCELEEELSKSREIAYEGVTIAGQGGILYVVRNERLYVLNLTNTAISVISRRGFGEVKVLQSNLRCHPVDLGIEGGKKFVGVHGLTFLIDGGPMLSLASAEPIAIEFAGKHMVKLQVWGPSTLFISKGKTCVQILREALVYSNMVGIKGAIRSRQPIVEVLDPLTLAMPLDFDRGCVEMFLANPDKLSYNSIIKVYGYIDEVTVDGLARFKPRYSVLRVALPEYGKSRIRLCVSTYIPKRVDMVLRFTEAWPTSLQP